MDVDFCRYYKHAELTSVLKKLAKAHPRKMKLRSIGKSPAQRDIWMAEITNPNGVPRAAANIGYCLCRGSCLILGH